MLAAAVLLAMTASCRRRIDSVAVLPFENVSGDPQREYAADGLTESVLGGLTRIPDLRVIGRTSVFLYKGRPTNVAAVGRELGVGSVLVGRVVRQGERVRVEADLFRPDHAEPIWSGQFDRPRGELGGVALLVAESVTKALGRRFPPGARDAFVREESSSPEARDAYWQGRYWFNKRTREGLERARSELDRAVAVDPRFALAWAGLADCWNVTSNYGLASPGEAVPKAKAAAERALALDENLAEGHTALAFSKTYYDWDWAGGEREFRRAIALKPGYATAHHWFAFHLAARGRLDESAAEFRRARELDPRSLIILVGEGVNSYWARRYDDAIEKLRRPIEISPSFGEAHYAIGRAFEAKGNAVKALAELQTAVALSPGSPGMLAGVGHAQAHFGDTVRARETLARLDAMSAGTYVAPYLIATVAGALGDRDRAFALLDRAAEERSSWMAYLKIDPALDELRSDPRFAVLLRRTGLGG